MVIKGIVEDGWIKIDASSLPEGTEVLITPTNISTDIRVQSQAELSAFKLLLQRIADLPCENELADHFSGVDHDRILYH